jgi:hypothetical protein
MAKYLGIFRDTVDEIVFDGFVWWQIEKWKALKSWHKYTWGFFMMLLVPMLEYDSGEDLLSRIDFKEITNSDYDLFR